MHFNFQLFTKFRSLHKQYPLHHNLHIWLIRMLNISLIVRILPDHLFRMLILEGSDLHHWHDHRGLIHPMSLNLTTDCLFCSRSLHPQLPLMVLKLSSPPRFNYIPMMVIMRLHLDNRLIRILSIFVTCSTLKNRSISINRCKSRD